MPETTQPTAPAVASGASLTMAMEGAVAVLFVNDPHSGRNELEQAKKQVAGLAQAVATAAVDFEAVDPKDAEKAAAAGEP